MLSLAALHAERSSALIFPVSRPTQSIIYYAKRYSGWHHRAHHCSSSIVERVFVFPTSSLTKSILGIPFQKNVLKCFCHKGEVLATHCFSSYPAATQKSLFPPAHTHALSITAFSCAAEKEPAGCRPFHST